MIFRPYIILPFKVTEITLYSNNFIRVFIQSYIFNIATLTLSNQIRHFFTATNKQYLFLTERSKNLCSKHYFVTSTILSCEFFSSAPITLKNLQFKVLFYKNVIIQQLLHKKKKNKDCTTQSVTKTDLKTERIENYVERQI